MTLSDLYARKHALNAELDAMGSQHVWDGLAEDSLLTELDRVCDRIDAIEEAQYRETLSPCCF